MAEGRDARLGFGLAALIVFANAAWVSSHLGIAHRVRDVLETDHRHYIRMALQPGEPEEPPYAFRVATPALARGLMRTGLTVNQAFYSITQASLVGFLGFTWLFLRALGFDRGIASLVLCWMGFTQGAVRWFEYQYWMSDPPCLALVAAALWAIESERWRVAIALAFVAGAVRESFVLVLPYLFAHAWRTRGLSRAFSRTAAVGGAFAVVAAWLRTRITATSVDDWSVGIIDSMGFRYRHAVDQQWYVLTVGTWAVCFAFAVSDPRALVRTARHRFDLSLLALATYASLAISNNTERPLAYAWPAVAAAAGAALQAIREATSRRQFFLLVITATLVQAIHFVETRWYQLMGASLYQPANILLAALIVTFAVVLARVRRSAEADVSERRRAPIATGGH